MYILHFVYHSSAFIWVVSTLRRLWIMLYKYLCMCFWVNSCYQISRSYTWKWKSRVMQYSESSNQCHYFMWSFHSVSSMNYFSSVWAWNIVCTLAFQCFVLFVCFSRTLGNFFPLMHKSTLIQKYKGTPLLALQCFLCSLPSYEPEQFCPTSDLFSTQQGC